MGYVLYKAFLVAVMFFDVLVRMDRKLRPLNVWRRLFKRLDRFPVGLLRVMAMYEPERRFMAYLTRNSDVRLERR